jgi:hypothetical protein
MPSADEPDAPILEAQPQVGENVQQTMDDLSRAADAARSVDRDDLAARAEGAQRSLLHREFTVAVVGEFKQGKSTLVNAMLQTAVCPVDADIVTAAPTWVRFGAEPQARAFHQGEDPNDESGGHELPLGQLTKYISESRDDAGERINSVEVRLDRNILRAGLSFLDTPGVGGLDTAHGKLTLAVLPMATAAIFVSDASQELTEPEVDFLRDALGRCSTILIVITKIDLYPEWRRIVALDRAHLQRAGLDVPIVAVSSFLRLRASTLRDQEMNSESQFPELFDMLREHVLASGEQNSLALAAQELSFVVDQVRSPAAMEHQVLTEPSKADKIIDRLTEAEEKTRRLTSSSANWQTLLNDGLQDLVARVDHDLRERFAGLRADGEAAIDAGDPKDDWEDFRLWAERNTTQAVVDNHELLLEGAGTLTTTVGRRFSSESSDALQQALDLPDAKFELPAALTADFAGVGGSRFMRNFNAARASYGGAAIVMVAENLLRGALGLGLAATATVSLVAAPLTIAFSVYTWRRVMRDERERQVVGRRSKAKEAYRKYVNEANVAAAENSRESLRRMQRLLRDEFTARAAAMHESSGRALSSVRKAARADPDVRERRSQELDELLTLLRDLAKRAERAGEPGWQHVPQAASA